MASKKKSSVSKATKKKSRKPSGEAKTMEELLKKTSISLKTFAKGDRVKGKILRITNKSVFIDIGGKGEGIVAERAFNDAKSFIKTLKVGDEIEAKVLVTLTPDGYSILSLREEATSSAWRKLRKAEKLGKAIEVLGVASNPSGVKIEVNGMSGFVPASQIGKDYRGRTNELVGRRFEVKVLDLDRGANKIVLSERGVSEEEDIRKVKNAMKKIKFGEIYDGKVTKVYDFGCFVEIRVSMRSGDKVGVEGLVHISELSWEKVNDPRKIVKQGSKVKVKALEVKDGKLSLSIKQAQKDPWDEAGKKYKKDSKVKGKVTKISDYGVFVQLEPGIEGLIHITKIPPGKKLQEGQEINIYVEEIDSKERKLSLGLVLTAKPVGYK